MTDSRLEHLDPATIAALVDQTLDSAARAEAEAHLAACADCREVWVETSEIDNEMRGATTIEQARDVVVPSRARSQRSWIYAAAGIAAAVVMGVAIWQLRIGWRPEDRALHALVDAVGTSRFAVARLSVPFEYGPAPSVQRGTASGYRPSAAVEEAATRLHELNTAAPSTESMRAAAIAYLATGDAGAAVAMLDRIRDADPAAAVDTDLAAALLERWRLTGSSDDAARALHYAEAAVSQDATDLAALFNRALALEAVGLKPRAAMAWEEYLTRDRDSTWRTEAEARLQALRGSGRHESPPPVPAIAGDASARQSKCADAFASSKARWNQLWEDADYARAAIEARTGRAALICAGLPTLESDMQLAFGESAKGNVQVARPMLMRALSEATRAQAWEVAGRSSVALGVIAFREGDVQAGTKYLKDAIGPANASQLPYLKAIAHSMLADAYQEQGETRAVWTHQIAAIEALHGVSGNRTAYTVLSGAAVNARAGALPGAALRFADELLRVTGSWANPGGQLFAHLERARAFADLGRAQAALDDLAAAERILLSLEEPLRSSFRAEILATEGRVKTRLDPTAAVGAFTESLSLFDQEQNSIRRVSLLLDRGRAYSAGGNMRDAGADWRQAAQLIERERGSISDRQLRIARFSHVWDLYDELIKAERDPLQSLALMERVRARELTQSGNSLHDPQALIDWLPSDAAAVVYATMTDSLFVWTATREGVQLTRHPIGAARLGRLVDEHNDRVLKNKPDFGVYLGELLLPDAMHRAPKRRTLFVADGPLHRLSFGTLRSRDGRRLIQWTEPTMSPALRMARPSPTACAAPVARRALLAGFGEASPEEGLPPLPSVERELNGIAQIYRGAVVLSGNRASVPAVLREADTASLIHIAAHAIADLSTPARSRILLAPSGATPGSLTAADIEQMKLAAHPLVVLPACETAAGRVFRGEGAVSLSTPFLLAGASGVVGTLWAIGDADAARLMLDFHQALAAGQPPSSALAAAQRAAESRQLPARSWSAFVHFGTLSKDSQPCQISRLSSKTSD